MDENGGAEWGWASLVLGAVFAVMSPQLLILIDQIVARGFGAVGAVPASVGGGVCGSLAMAICGLGVYFGLRGVADARRAGRAPVLGVAGALLCGFDLLVWSAAAVAWIASVARFLP